MNIVIEFRALIKKLLLLLFVYAGLRLVFLVLNFSSLSIWLGPPIFSSFWNGLRFDLSAILLLNAPLIILSLIPGINPGHRGYQLFLRIVFWLLNLPFLAVNLIDTEFYKFTGKRMTFDIFLLKREMGEQAGQLFLNYWHLVLIFGFLAMVMRTLYPNPTYQTGPLFRRPKIYEPLVFLLAIALSVVGMRGGLQRKVLQPTHAYELGEAELGILTLNSTFTFLKSKERSRLAPVEFYPGKKEVISVINRPSYLTSGPKGEGENVVILILESLATEFWGAANDYAGYTPFLDSLAARGLFFEKNFANGRRSIEALPSILFGLPALMDTPIAKSDYQSNRFHGLGSLLKRNGYHTSFFHGAEKGTMYFDAISKMAGLEDYYPLERYKESEDGGFDGHWGIFDEPFLQYMVHHLGQHPQPFFSTVFTISTHQPYQVPPEYEGQFPSGDLKIHASVGYVDHAVKRFFEEAEKQPWYENTLFILTGDHTQMSASQFYDTPIGRYRVPLLFFHPKKNMKEYDASKVTQHADILPTVLDYLNIPDQPYPLFGRSVFSDGPGIAINQSQGVFWLVNDQEVLRWIDGGNSEVFSWRDPALSSPINSTNKPMLEKQLKAYVQYFRNGLINNSLYKWTK